MANETRSYTHSKLNAKGLQVFKGSPLVRMIRDLATPHTKDGATVSVGWVVEEIQKSKKLRLSHETRLATMVGDCIREGSVPGFGIKRGKHGGIFNIAAFKDAFGVDGYNALRASRESAKATKKSAKVATASA